MTELHYESLHADPAKRWDRFLIAALAVCTAALYLRTAHFDFVLFDDQLYIYSNTYVVQGLSLPALRWAMTARLNGNWHPLTTIVQLTISSIFGINPAAFHMVSVALHVLNVVLLYLFLRRATGLLGPAFFTALLWGLHPLRVESVVWVTELKDVLCGAFWLGCMLAYLNYSYRRTFRGYLIVLLMLVLALLSKPMAVTLPAVLLLLDFWPLRPARSAVPAATLPVGGSASAPVLLDDASPLPQRSSGWINRVLEKIPLFALCIGDAFTEQRSVPVSFHFLPMGLRIQNAFSSYVWYLRDLFFPKNLLIFYPHPVMTGQTIPILTTLAAAALLLAISVAVVQRVRVQPCLMFGWFWFLGTLVPVIGLIQSGEQARADRFTYLPSIGIVLAVVWWIRDLTASARAYRALAVTAGTAAAIALSVVSWIDITPWKNSDTLFVNLDARDPTNYFGIAMDGFHYFNHHQPDRGLEMEKRAAAMASGSFNTQAAYARMLWGAAKISENAGKLDDAIIKLNSAHDYYLRSLKMSESQSQNWDGLGNVYATRADIYTATNDLAAARKARDLAISAYRRGVLENPIDTDPREHLAYQLEAVGKTDEALAAWDALLNLYPADAQARGQLADALLLKGDQADAVDNYNLAVSLGAKVPSWETKLSWLVATNPQLSPQQVQLAVPIAKDACEQTHDQNAAALDAYAASLARVGRFDDAVAAVKAGIARALAQPDPALARQMQKRLTRYQAAESYVFVDDSEKTKIKSPSTTQSAQVQRPATNPQ